MRSLSLFCALLLIFSLCCLGAAEPMSHSVTQWLILKHFQSVKPFSFSTRELVSDPIVAISISPDGSTIATGHFPAPIGLWNLKTGKLIKSLPDRCIKYGFSNHFVAITPNGLSLVATADKRAKVYDISTGKLLSNLKSHSQEITSLAISRDGSRVVTVSRDSVNIEDVTTGVGFAPGRLIYSLSNNLPLQRDFFVTAALMPDSRHVVIGCRKGDIYRFDIETKLLTHMFKADETGIDCLAIAQDGSKLVTKSDAGTIKAWKLPEGKLISTFNSGVRDDSSNITITPDGAMVITGFKNGDIMIWYMATGKLIETLNMGTKKSVNPPPLSTALTADYDLVAAFEDTVTVFKIDDRLRKALSELTPKQINFLTWVYEFAEKGEKADLTQETPTTIEYIEQYGLLPTYIQNLIEGHLKLE